MVEPIQSESTLNQALAAQRAAWERDERVQVESLLIAHQIHADDHAAILDLVYQEYCLREAAGDIASVAEYRRRFPALADKIETQLEVHQAMANEDAPHAAPAAPLKHASPPASVAKYPAALAGFAALIEAGLFEVPQLTKLMSHEPESSRPRDTAAAVKFLSQRKLLTPFQVERILANKLTELKLGHYIIIDLIGTGGWARSTRRSTGGWTGSSR